jgi:hypothetical protein
MEFFQTFSSIYNQVNKTHHFAKIIPPSDEDWMVFSKKVDTLTNQQKENLYLTILHYHFLTTKKMEEFPYGIKRKGKDIIINYTDIPFTLQHMLMSIL